jgi:hypothetical protein
MMAEQNDGISRGSCPFREDRSRCETRFPIIPCGRRLGCITVI